MLALAALATAGFLALGFWQLERRVWKLDLIARAESGSHADPVSIPTAGTSPVEYRRVRLSGHFDHSRETLVQAVTERGAGFWVMTPLNTGATTVLVNRGFVSPEHRAPGSRPGGLVSGRVSIVGLTRLSEPGGGFLRNNDPASDHWYSRDVAAIAAARRIGPVAPYFVDADATPNPGGWPVGGLTVLRFRNNHLTYAITWFALAAISAFAVWRLGRGARV